MGAALAQPSEQPRVLVVPQWCLDPPDSPSEAFLLPKGGGAPSLGLDDLRSLHRKGTAGLCHLRTGNTVAGDAWFGAAVMEDVVDCGEREEGGGLRGASRRRGRADREIENGLALLRSDVASPILVVDMWSAPALFLRHVEVGRWADGCDCVGWERGGRVLGHMLARNRGVEGVQGVGFSGGVR